jgi:signal transduction histidine kinase
MTAVGSLALAETNANAARSVAEDSTSLNWANATAGSVAIARAALHQALHFRISALSDDVAPSAAAEAVDEAAMALEAAHTWIADAPVDQRNVAAAISDTMVVADDVLALVVDGDIAEADRVLEELFEPAYTGNIGLLYAVQDAVAARITTAQTDSAETERLTRIFVTLLIPAAAIIIGQLMLRRRHRDERLQMLASLEAEQEINRSKDIFIASFSHELRTPLTSIYGFADYLVESRLADPHEAMDLVKVIRSDASELSRMVEDILVAARLESGEMNFDDSAVDLMALAHQERDLFANEGHAIKVHAVPSYAWATEKHVSQILRNLISNAVRYGGSDIDVVVAHTGGQATISVADSGPGVPEEVRDRMFTRFLNEGEMTLLKGSVGLGLSVSRALAAVMGGTIAYERKLGWTNFIVALPAASADQIAASSVPTPPSATGSGLVPDGVAPGLEPTDAHQDETVTGRHHADRGIVVFDEYA